MMVVNDVDEEHLRHPLDPGSTLHYKINLSALHSRNPTTALWCFRTRNDIEATNANKWQVSYPYNWDTPSMKRLQEIKKIMGERSSSLWRWMGPWESCRRGVFATTNRKVYASHFCQAQTTYQKEKTSTTPCIVHATHWSNKLERDP